MPRRNRPRSQRRVVARSTSITREPAGRSYEHLALSLVDRGLASPAILGQTRTRYLARNDAQR